MCCSIATRWLIGSLIETHLDLRFAEALHHQGWVDAEQWGNLDLRPWSLNMQNITCTRFTFNLFVSTWHAFLRNENSISRLLFNLKRSSDLGFAKSFTQVRFPNELQNKLSACRRCGIASFNVLQINRRLENPVGKTWRRVVCRTFKSESFYKYFYKWELHKTSALDVFELQNKFYAACRCWGNLGTSCQVFLLVSGATNKPFLFLTLPLSLL